LQLRTKAVSAGEKKVIFENKLGPQNLGYGYS